MEKITKIIQKIVNLTHKQLSGQMLYWEQQQVLEVGQMLYWEQHQVLEVGQMLYWEQQQVLRVVLEVGQMLYWEQQQVLRVVLAVVLVNVEVRNLSDHYVRPST